MFGRLVKSLGLSAEEEEGSVGVTDERLIRKFTDNPEFPYLVSFPRTGSHWLRLLMELYFGKPSLVRAFYTENPTDFTCCHSHDDDLALRRRNVIYLYRNPVPTIYSQLQYYKENCDDRERIAHWAAQYGRHLMKWLATDDFTARKTVVTYEGLKSNLAAEFEKICRHLDAPFDPERLRQAAGRVSKEDLKRKTRHDQQVVNLSRAYDDEREAFCARHAAFVMETVIGEDPALRALWA